MRPPDLDQLVDAVVSEVAAALRARGGLLCACHAVLDTCCPERIGPVLQAGADRLGLHAAGGRVGDLASTIDHTLLKPDATRAEIETLCREAVAHGFATVCVNPVWVAACAALVRAGRQQPSGVPRGRSVRPGVCSVVGFPLGASTSDTKSYEARRAIFDGADEIDMVINIGALKSRDLERVARDVEAVTTPCGEHGVLSKVIIEAALLSDEEKVAACAIAKAAGADYVKTSTGFGPGGATVHDVALMRRVVGDAIGVKAAGGVRDLATAEAMIAAGASRLGASAGVRIVRESQGK